MHAGKGAAEAPRPCRRRSFGRQFDQGGVPSRPAIGTNFSGAELSGANLNKTDVKNASFTNANAPGIMFYESDLSVANLTGANLVEAKMGKARAVRTILDNTKLTEAILTGARLDDASLKGAALQRANLIGVSMRRTNLEGANLEDSGLIDAIMREANLKGANLSGADLFGADLTGADLTGADLSEIAAVACDPDRRQARRGEFQGRPNAGRNDARIDRRIPVRGGGAIPSRPCARLGVPKVGARARQRGSRGQADGRAYAPPARIGGWNASPVSQGKQIQVSCDTSVTKVSTSGRPSGLA